MIDHGFNPVNWYHAVSSQPRHPRSQKIRKFKHTHTHDLSVKRHMIKYQVGQRCCAKGHPGPENTIEQKHPKHMTDHTPVWLWYHLPSSLDIITDLTWLDWSTPALHCIAFNNLVMSDQWFIQEGERRKDAFSEFWNRALLCGVSRYN